MTFDPTTIIITAAALGVVMGCVQWLAWLHVRSEGSLAIWSGANLACAVGLAIMALPGGTAPRVIPAANAWFLLATGMTYIGMLSFDRAPISRRLVALVVVTALGTALLTMLFSDSPLARRAVFSLATVGWMGAAAWRLARIPPTGPAFSRLAVALFLSMFCALHLARLVAAAMGFTPFFAAPVAEQLSWTLLLSLVCGVGLNYGALFMVLDRLASCDELTGLSNRRALQRGGQAALKFAHAHHRPLSVMLVDLDHFKTVNDRFGHRIGDRALVRFAEVAKDTVRPGDLIGRYGGEEFCVVLRGVDGTAAMAVAERLRARVAEALAMVDGHPAGVTVAIGLATWDGDDPLDTIDQLIDAADGALYAAKDGGRNRVIVAPPRHSSQRKTAPAAMQTPSLG